MTPETAPMQSHAHPPVELIFARAAQSRVRIDAMSQGRTCQGQGDAYDSGAIIAALTTRPAASDVLCGDGFVCVPGEHPGTALFRRTDPAGVYSLRLEPEGLSLDFAPTREGDAPRSLLRLSRARSGALWPEDCASEAAHIAVALAVARHHAERTPSH